MCVRPSMGEFAEDTHTHNTHIYLYKMCARCKKTTKKKTVIQLQFTGLNATTAVHNHKFSHSHTHIPAENQCLPRHTERTTEREEVLKNTEWNTR